MPSAVSLDVLDQARIASPCPMRWEAMSGDDRVRHCAQCDLNVYNVESLTRAEAIALVSAAEGGRVCVRLHRRADGTILTRDCPVGVSRARAAWSRTVGIAAALVALFGSGAALALARTRSDAWHAGGMLSLSPHRTVANAISPGAKAAPAPVFTPSFGAVMMGELCPPPAPTPTTTGSR